ncbi:potassium channel subfamily K, other eukaryote [Entomortierella parvispora]|uniref:Potassium channel subfamily K, other eukaryote n=1 Tax=Entomortierella parvispora TaxID=205924 RepID=A0A9P3H6F1_9FUNG|nr:potassium channel subfamily K, other eukaryote [Entomortierella parvispora]
MPSLSHGHGYTVAESSSSATTRRRGSSSSFSDENVPHPPSSAHTHTHHTIDTGNANDSGNSSSDKNHNGSITSNSNSTRSINRSNSDNGQGEREKNSSLPLDPQRPSLSTIARIKFFFQGLRRSFLGHDGSGQVVNGHRVDPSLLLESNYRVLPLLIGCIIPVSILINVPSITSPWVGIPVNGTGQDYDDDDPKVVPIPHWLDCMIILALVMAIICNICVLFRFLERHVWHSVILSLITATLQDILCIGSIVPFCILYPPSKGYVYLEGFWTMIASMVFSLTATVLMSIDFHRTPQFRLQGSGVTHKQRILIAEAMSLCFYLAIGALIFIYLEHWSFLDALFFVMVTITTIGFGDRVPETTGGRVFVIFYGAGGIVLLAMAVNAIRYVILEDLHRRFAIRAKERKAKRDARRQERREQRAIQEERRQRLLEVLERFQQLESTPITNSPNESHGGSHYFTHTPRQFTFPHGQPSKLLSMFSRTQTKDIADSGHGVGSDLTLEGGQQPATFQRTNSGTNNLQKALEELQLSRNGITADDYQRALEGVGGEDSTSLELLRLATMEPHQFQALGKPSLFKRLMAYRRGSDVEPPIQNPTAEEQREADKRQAYVESMQEYRRRLRFSAAMFLTFWLAGAVIFTFVESWNFGDSVYFVFIAFSTIGYGDFVPRTMAGKAIFLAYCLVGVVALTSLASLISEVLSKTMRKHVVETQLRRTERIEALEGDHELGENNDGDQDLEQGATVDSFTEDGGIREGSEELDNAARTQSDGNETPPTPNTCQGSLENLVKISKDFDQLLQKVLGLDSNEDENQSSAADTTTPPPLSTPGAIVEYLEKEEDDEMMPSFLSPSISRDINSTSTIHQHTARPSLPGHGRRHSVDPRGGTFHNFGSSSPNDSTQIQIKAWPTSISSHVNLGSERNSASPSPVPSLPAASTGSARRQNKDGSITIAALHWQNLISYAKQLKALTAACEDAMERVAAWEVSESKLRQKRRQARMRQKRLLNERRRRLNELGTRGTADVEIDQEDELEELDEWDEEGSDADEDDEILDRHRVKITAALLGSKSPKKSRSRHSSRHPSRNTSRRTSLQGGMDPNFLQPPPPPMALSLHLRARNPSLDDRSGHLGQPTSRARERNRPSHHQHSRRDSHPHQHTVVHHSAHVGHSTRGHRPVNHSRHDHGQHTDALSDHTDKMGLIRPFQLSPLQTNMSGLPPSSSSPEQPTEPRITFMAASPHPLDRDEPSFSLGSGVGPSKTTRSPLGHLFFPVPDAALHVSTPGSTSEG